MWGKCNVFCSLEGVWAKYLRVSTSLYLSKPCCSSQIVAATQIHSSLLSRSVGVVLLPAAYHFTLVDADQVPSEAQKLNILHSMSHGVWCLISLRIKLEKANWFPFLIGCNCSPQWVHFPSGDKNTVRDVSRLWSSSFNFSQIPILFMSTL